MTTTTSLTNDLSLKEIQAATDPELYSDSSINCAIFASMLARQLLATMQREKRLRIELQSASNQLELLAYTSAGNDHGLSKFCAGLAGHMKKALNQNEVSDAG